MKKLLLSLLLVGSLYAQAPRPPVSFLSQLSDVNISSPVDDQPLVYDAASAKWGNTNTLDNIILQSTTIASPGTVANFGTARLTHPTGGDLIDWSGGGLKILSPLQDTSGIAAENVSSRQLLGTDGTTVKFQWDSTGVKFPTLTNSNPSAFLTTNASGVISVAAVPGAGTVASTNDILAGDGAGNAVSSGLTPFGAGYKLFPTVVGGEPTLAVQNLASNGTASLQVGNDSTTAGLRLVSIGTTFSTVGLLTGGDAQIGAANTGSRLIISQASGPILFSNDGATTERVRIGNGLAVGTTTDPGAGVVNVNTGFRIGNTAPLNAVLIGNGTNYVSGSAPASLPSGGTVGQILYKNSSTANDASWKTPAFQQTTALSPSATTNTTGVMLGLGSSAFITPAATGRIFVSFTGQMSNNTAGDGVQIAGIRYGTGTAPVGGAALTGTQVGGVTSATGIATAGGNYPLSTQAVITGLTIGTSYWLDLNFRAVTGGTASVTNIAVSSYEF